MAIYSIFVHLLGLTWIESKTKELEESKQTAKSQKGGKSTRIAKVNSIGKPGLEAFQHQLWVNKTSQDPYPVVVSDHSADAGWNTFN